MSTTGRDAAAHAKQGSAQPEHLLSRHSSSSQSGSQGRATQASDSASDHSDTSTVEQEMPDRQVESTVFKTPSEQNEQPENVAAPGEHSIVSESQVEGDESQLDDLSAEMPPYDWDDLRKRYQERIFELTKTEEGLMKEFQDLTKLFSIWARSASASDADRSQRRLDTRICHVGISELGLEEKRARYQQVVHAFESALEILRQG